MGGKKKDRQIRTCLIVNARSKDDTFNLEEALPILTAQGWEVEVREKHEKGDAARLARTAVKDGFDPIVNCGGDGTLNEIVDALAGSDVAVGTIPGGTENVWSKQIGISQRSRVAAMQLMVSERVRVDLGKVEIDGKHTHHFLMMAGLGADGTVMQHTSRGLKNRIGPLAVGVAAAEALPALQTVPVQINMDGVRWDGAVSEIVVGNTRDYGGFTEITRNAYVDDGLLDLCIFTTDGVLSTVRQLTSLVIHRQPSEASSECYRAARITVQADSPLPLQLDGSVLDLDKDGPISYAFSAVPHGLNVLVPKTYDGAIFEHGIVPVLQGKKKKRKKKGKKG
ncbi:MAG TPA: diacylglycerol kinase family protein [Chloroflexota bacterium]|nr:diacylglycerol kinase family protein [Chloroflexota bacterium]